MLEPKEAVAAAASMIEVKVAWLKQKKEEDSSRLPMLDFDEQQVFSFDRRRTTFRMVKHSCSYPAPPHKVRMWCSSLGASPDLPPSMDLNTFINTFELITEEKHTLEMAHLTGGETIAFEMVSGEQVSELSTFLLGAQLKPPKIVAVDKKNLKESLSASVQKFADQFGSEVGRLPADLALARQLLTPEEQARIASVFKEQAAAAEIKRKQLADELIAEEEEEKAKNEKKKAKKKGKKAKQKEKKKAAAAEGQEDDDDDDDDDDEPESASSAATASAANGNGNGGSAAVCSSSSSSTGTGGGKAAGGGGRNSSSSGGGGADVAKEDAENKKLNGAAAASGPGGGGKKKEASSAAAEEEELTGLAKLVLYGRGEVEHADDALALEECWDGVPDAAKEHIECLRQQVLNTHDVIRALVEEVWKERDQREEMAKELQLLRSAASKATTAAAAGSSAGSGASTRGNSGNGRSGRR